MVYDYKRIPYRIDRPLTGLAGPDYDATISFGLPVEPEDSQYGKSRLIRDPGSDVKPVKQGCAHQFPTGFATAPELT